MKKIELASYPKCGNTWLRHLLSKHFNFNIHTDIPDFHQRHDETVSFIKPIATNAGKVGFYKSHIPNVKNINPDMIIVIYRHPLDVFLSSLNYFYINEWSDKFLDKEIKPVEELKKSGELDTYFDLFIKNAGANYFDSLLGDLSNYFKYLEYVSNIKKVTLLKYEELYDGRKVFFDEFFSKILGSKISCEDSLFIDVDKKTKQSGEKFYWKSTKKNYENFLSDSQIKRFYDEYYDDLLRYGY